MESQGAMTTSGPEILEVRCESCGATIRLEATRRTTRCLFCDAPSVVTLPPRPARPQPVFTLGFAVEQETAAGAVSRWIRQRKMAPFGLKNSVTERITGVYLPAYLYSATARSQFEVSIAETYHKIGFKDGSAGGTTIGRKEETEWRDLTGRRVAYVSDVMATASRSLSNEELEAIEPFDLTKLRHYSPDLLVGWSAEEPSMAPEECLQLARAEAEASVARSLGGFLPGDGYRSLRHHTELSEESIDLTLVPVWIFALRYHPLKEPVRILVNGLSGKAGGKLPFSWAKLGILLAAALLALALLSRLSS